MKVLLDSSYFFPLISVEIVESSREIIPFLIEFLDVKIQYSLITLFELSAKGAKLVNSGLLIQNDVVKGINALLAWEKIEITSPWSGEIQRLAIDFRHDHSDYIDCLILATAVVRSNILVTEDSNIKSLVNSNWSNKIVDVNDEFSVMNASEMEEKMT
ncbi:MAG: hypothetical protein ACTSW1_13600 [Candidatus Hodarchaeales archaeon]